MSAAPASVLVVGAGIVGLSTAWALARRGIAVTVVEKGAVPCPTAASADHHRLIRYAYPDSPGYAARIDAAFAAWERLFAELPGPASRYYADRGIMTLSARPGDGAERTRALYRRLGVAHEDLPDAEAVARRLPMLEPGAFRFGVIGRGGALMANRILADLADALRARGVRVLEHSPVVAATAEGVATLADGRTLPAERVVLAAGTALPALAPAMAGDLGCNRTLIVYADPPEDLAGAWEDAPCWSDLGAGTDLWGMAPIGGLGLKLGCGALGRVDADDADRVATAAEAEAMLARYAGRFRGIERFRPRFAQANYWMLAPGERFRLAAEGRLLAVSADSGHGFKFGALSGEDVAEAVATGAVEAVARRMAALDPEPAGA